MKPYRTPGADGRERVPFLQLLPNMVTLSGMCLGLTSIRFALEGRFAVAAAMILLTVLLDGFDGLLARHLRATSPIGAQLDSLSDFLCFGVAPGVLTYQLLLAPSGDFGWVFVLIFAAAACLRLARFNIMSGGPEVAEHETVRHFVGVPTPGGAILGLLPVFLTLGGLVDAREVPTLVGLWLGMVAVLMISTIHTFSPKALRVPRRLVGAAMFAVVVGIGLTFTGPWLMIVAVDMIYIALLVRNLTQARWRLFG